MPQTATDRRNCRWEKRQSLAEGNRPADDGETGPQTFRSFATELVQSVRTEPSFLARSISDDSRILTKASTFSGSKT